MNDNICPSWTRDNVFCRLGDGGIEVRIYKGMEDPRKKAWVRSNKDLSRTKEEEISYSYNGVQACRPVHDAEAHHWSPVRQETVVYSSPLTQITSRHI